MERLLNFIYEYRAFFTFLLLELFCAWLIIENNQYQSTRYFNTSNRIAAGIIGFSQDVREYFSLRNINSELAKENADLRTQLEQRLQSVNALQDSLKDSTATSRYTYVSAKVINNSTRYYKNFITINKGELDGIQPGMAAISPIGAVGKVKSVSDHFAVLISVLNIDDQMSCVINRTGHFGTVQWDGTDPRFVNLKYIPRHVKPLVGDTVSTSGFNAVFPEGILVGIITEVRLKEESPFYDLKVELAQDFGSLAYVQVVQSHLKQEKDLLEAKTIGEPK